MLMIHFKCNAFPTNDVIDREMCGKSNNTIFQCYCSDVIRWKLPNYPDGKDAQQKFSNKINGPQNLVCNLKINVICQFESWHCNKTVIWMTNQNLPVLELLTP